MTYFHEKKNDFSRTKTLLLVKRAFIIHFTNLFYDRKQLDSHISTSAFNVLQNIVFEVHEN